MLATRFSPRTRWITGIVTAVALSYGAFAVWERSSWRSLPHGGEARLFEIGYGEQMRLKQRGFQLNAARKWLGPRLEFLLGPAPFDLRSTFRTRSLYVAFASRGSTIDDLPRTGYCEIDLPGGQILRGAPTSLGNVRGNKIDLASFAVVPSSQKWLNVRLEFGGESLPFRLRNPAYTRIPASWSAKPLPQTQTFGNLSVTLAGVSVFKTYDSGAGSFWEARPEYSIGFSRDPESTRPHPLSHVRFCAPSEDESIRTALFCDPVWKVRVRVFRPHNDDVPDSEVRWLGRIPLPGPGEGRIFAGGLGTPATKGHLCGLVGPGLYHIIDGKIMPIATASEAPDPPAIVAFDPSSPASGTARKTAFSVQADSITLFFIDHTSDEERFSSDFEHRTLATLPALFLRDQSGRRIEIQEPEFDRHRSRQFRVTVVPSTTEVEIGLMHREIHADFYIPAPAPPPELHR